ncbi:MAG: DUF6882 domain-containing protein [Anaerolineae bacterium]
MTLDSLILKHGAQAYEKQVHFADLIGDSLPALKLDLPNGVLRIGKQIFAVQVLGTEAEATETWLWAWVNDDLPDAVLTLAHQMRAYGDEHAIPELHTGNTIPVDDRVSGHRLGLLACALFGGDAYFRMPYEGGALYLIIQDAQFPPDTRHPVTRITSSFPQFIQNMRIFDHLTALQSYAKYHQLKTSLSREEGLVMLTAKHADGSTLSAKFDARERITHLQSTMREATK